MTLAARTLYAVLDNFQKMEGIWRSTVLLSYREIYAALEIAEVCFAEWDANRGLYYLDFSTSQESLITTDITSLEFTSDLGSDHYRLEWAENNHKFPRRLSGAEFQTHSPLPLPFIPEIDPWLFPEQRDQLTRILTMDGWEAYLRTLKPASPIIH